MAALAISIASLVLSAGGFAYATGYVLTRPVATGAARSKSRGATPTGEVNGHRLSSTPYAGGVLLLGSNRKFPAAAIPTVRDSTEFAAARSASSPRAARRRR